MKTIIDPKNHESVLAQWANAEAKIWIFHVSLKRMAIVLTRKGERNAIYIVAIGCENISGPFSWKRANIIIEKNMQKGDVRYRVIDRQAKFDLLCGGVAIAHGPATVPINPFDNFIGDTMK
jgi:hypothetical protein